MKQPLILITGPTAVGKSAMALKLCQEFQGEIISADSRQVYKGMDIATAKPTAAELAQIPHHLIDIIAPDQEFTLPEFQTRATATIEDILVRGKVPFLVGGTVLYINAICEGWDVPQVAPDLEWRKQLEKEATTTGTERMFNELKAIDPEAAAHMTPTNARRIIRALEVYRVTGRKFSEAQGKSGPAYRLLKLGLTLEREKLYARADQRIEEMFQRGLVEEVKKLLDLGYDPKLPAMSSLGYGHVVAYLRGEIKLEEAKTQMSFATHRYIRHQYSWFRRDPTIIWLDAATHNYLEIANEEISRFLQSSD